MSTGERFATRLGAWLSLLGVAIGLGNVWRFPYMMGRHGGSAFLLLYLGLTALFAAPLLAAEWGLGRRTRQGPIGSYRAAFGHRAGTALGGLLVVSILVADSYYMVVIGNILYTALFAAGRGFSPGTAAATRWRPPESDGLRRTPVTTVASRPPMTSVHVSYSEWTAESKLRSLEYLPGPRMCAMDANREQLELGLGPVTRDTD